MTIVLQETHAGMTVKVCIDDDPLNPRKEYDNATTIVHWHRRYDLGDKVEQVLAAELLEDYHEKGNPILAIVPLYLLDHSGISISIDSFNDRFDSGQVGWAFITKSDADKMGYEYMTLEEYVTIIKAEVETFDHYLRGNVYGYIVESRNGEELESCCGFIGSMNDALAEGKSMAEGIIDPAIQEEADELAARATFAGI